jgi:hypothetical protein
VESWVESFGKHVRSDVTAASCESRRRVWETTPRRSQSSTRPEHELHVHGIRCSLDSASMSVARFRVRLRGSGGTARRFADSVINGSGGQVGDKQFTGPSYWPVLLNIQRIVRKLGIAPAVRA